MSLHVNLLIYLETVACSTITIVIKQHNWCSTYFSVVPPPPPFNYSLLFFCLNAYIYDLNRFSHSFINLWQYDVGPSVSFLDPTVSKSSELHRFSFRSVLTFWRVWNWRLILVLNSAIGRQFQSQFKMIDHPVIRKSLSFVFEIIFPFFFFVCFCSTRSSVISPRRYFSFWLD